MKKMILFLLLFCTVIISQNQKFVIEKKYEFEISARGVKSFDIEIPANAKKIRAKIYNHTAMMNLKIIGPNNDVLSKNSTWSNLSNWKKPIKCSVGIVNNKRQHPGLWKIKIEGSVHKNDIKKINSIKGILLIEIETVGNPIKQKPTSLLPVEKIFEFEIGARNSKFFEINVPKNAKRIEAKIVNHTEMINLKIIGPNNDVLSKNSTWSNLSNWKKPIKCSVGIVNNKRQHPGLWKIKIEGSVHINNVKNVNKISGKLIVKIK